jgi:hypothetical protein
MAESVKVIVRCRPMNKKEKDLKCKTVVFMDNSRNQCSMVSASDANAPPKNFAFDGAYGTDSTTEQIYEQIAYPLVEVCTTARARRNFKRPFPRNFNMDQARIWERLVSLSLSLFSLGRFGKVSRFGFPPGKSFQPSK